MTRIDTAESKRTRSERVVGILLVVVACVVVAGALAALTAPAAAQSNNSTNVSDKAPYYANNTTDVPRDSWFDGRENATLVNTTAMLTRIGTYVVGTGDDVQGGGGPAGVVVLGLVLIGSVLGTLRGSGVGSVGGPVIMFATAALIVGLGLTPTWLLAVVLLGLGVVASVVVIRAL